MSSAATPPDPDSEPISPRPPVTPPPASPFASPGSLSRLGISPFSRQFTSRGAYGDKFSSPGRDTSPFTRQLSLRGAHDERPGSSEEDASRDSRDVLARRLADLAERVSGELGDEGVTEMHRWVDELEDVVSAGRKPAKKARVRPKSLDINATRDAPWGPSSPFALLRSGFSDPTPLGEAALQGPPRPSEPVDETLQLPALVQMKPPPKKGRASVEDAARIAREAEQLNYHLATLITRLQARQEESEVSEPPSPIALGIVSDVRSTFMLC